MNHIRRNQIAIIAALATTLAVSLGIALAHTVNAGQPAGNSPPSQMMQATANSPKHGYVMNVYTDPHGRKMTYYLYVPTGYNPHQKYPLVLLLQGGGERAQPNFTPARNAALVLDASYVQDWAAPMVQAKWPSFIVVPQVPYPQRFVNVPASQTSFMLSPQPSTSLLLAKEIVGMLQHKYTGIDANRLYITGLSMGGDGTWDAIERWPSYFAAAAPIAGAGDPTKAARLVNLPIWAFHGSQDTIVPVTGSRTMIRAIAAAGGHPRYTEYPGAGHGVWNQAYTDPAFFAWLFSQKR
jgi:predicted peptidase